MANISLHERKKTDSRLREQVEKSDWKTYAAAAVVNAFYSSVDNAISKLNSVHFLMKQDISTTI